MKKSITKRIRVTKNGLLLHRPMAVDHFKSKKSGTAKQAKRKERKLNYNVLKIIRLTRSYNKIAHS
ncbi:MAG: hypothetical protein A3A04_00925 [Candidatus Harrisonbacteria bacterium RIFCSPLOWO2_01_FULL_40_28]|uniref:50S ribosomal protein L35 n=2 Tax=Candidatus Harrisoniibacteriota TaxID=1817905 RepID=A0A1G2A0T5_9BACT|nr:MAG: hypothetical protein A3A04_00925 [Candidatus Harrisonbacteria bacterium RIFCSPLOWO2_01_FULL_40_28]OGY69680.1 MAG: hypothetical protein A2586_01625 [Candidatus Harrisonbacteria bacterium RIFOXYD1_FULL_40_9]